LRKNLRNNSTSAENVLWGALQKRKLAGRKFRRQQSIENFIVDFYCPREKLIIEVDGGYHAHCRIREYDLKRTEKLEALGYNVIRFKNKLIFHHLDQVLETIKEAFHEN
jgi:very-short-patch-repair endonuclease